MNPRVTVVVPTRNRCGTLARALAGVTAQDFRDHEVVVINDASSDDTAAWLNEHQPDCRVISLKEPVGAAAARNVGIHHARGEFIAFLDDDDVWRPTYLGVQVRHLDANPSADLSFAGHLEIDRRSGRTATPDTVPLFDYASPLVRLCAEMFIHTMSVVMCRRDLFRRLGPFDERLTVVHDLEWYGRVLLAGGHFTQVPEVLVARATPGGLVTRHRVWYEEEREVVGRLLAGNPNGPLVRAYRSLYFARIALARGDVVFGLRRLVEAFQTSPAWTISIASRRMLRRLRPDRPTPTWATAS